MNDERKAERGMIFVGPVGGGGRDVLLTVTEVEGDRIHLLGHLGYGTVDIEATWPGAIAPDRMSGPINADDYEEADNIVQALAASRGDQAVSS
jgi:hypothetical protein